MTETIEAPVAPVIDIATKAPRRRVVGKDAEAALAERKAAIGDEEVYYALRGVEYRLQQPLPAAFLLHAASLTGDDTSLESFEDVIRAAFHPADQDKFYAAILDTSVETPVDVDYLGEMLNELSEAATARPTNS